MHDVPENDGLILFITEHQLPGMSEATLAAIHRGLSRATDRVSGPGRPVRYLRGTYMPTRGRWICLFAAGDEAAVREAIALAQLPGVAVEHAVEHSGEPAAWS